MFNANRYYLHKVMKNNNSQFTLISASLVCGGSGADFTYG